MASSSAYKSIYMTRSVLEENSDLHINLNNEYPSQKSYFNNFDRYYSIYSDLELSSLTQWVFFIRPECNILNEVNSHKVSDGCANDRFIVDMVKRHNTITQQLTNNFSTNHDFIPFLVGRTEGLPIPDFSIKNYTISQPYTNLLMPYGGNAWESKTGGTFDVVFREDNQLRVHKFFQLWTHYIDGVSRGEWDPKDKYWRFNKLDYASSAYYFICAPDGESILWWSKYTGVFPTGVPNSDLSFNLRGSAETRVSIPFVYFYHEVLNPDVICDFNRNANVSGRVEYVPHYVDSLNTAGSANGVVGVPFVSTDNNGMTYKLRWKEPIIY